MRRDVKKELIMKIMKIIFRFVYLEEEAAKFVELSIIKKICKNIKKNVGKLKKNVETVELK